MKPLLVGDIGGTNARLGLVTECSERGYVINRRSTYATAEFTSLEECLRRFLDDMSTRPRGACLAVAGPVRGNAVKMTNLTWRVDGSSAAKLLGLPHARVMNDFEAMAWATLHRSQTQAVTIRDGTAEDQGTRAVIGPGTGLGVSALAYANGHWSAVSGEGGHLRCPRYECMEASLWNALLVEGDALTLESLLSGSGMERLYRALAREQGAAVDDYPRAPDITRDGLDGSDALCRRTLELMCEILGCAARDYALTFGALGGVYLSGGILPRFVELLQNSRFQHWFTHHQTYAELLAGIPVWLMTSPDTALIGAAACYRNATLNGP